jgi:signal peptidase I
MKRLFFLWILPVLIAICLVIFFRIFVVEVISVTDSSMKSSMLKNEKHVFLKFFKLKTNKAVLLKGFPFANSLKIQRIVAIPGNKVLITNSVLYINNVRNNDPQEVSYTYKFRTDSLEFASNLLINNHISFNTALSEIGIFKFNTDIKNLKLLKSQVLFKRITREIEDPNLYISPVLASKHVVYWNKDNMGPIIVPASGLCVKMDKKSFILYKNQIEEETGQILEISPEGFRLGGNKIDSYTFKHNYYFLLNDRRDDMQDSRTYGFVNEKYIIGAHFFKMPFN